MTQPTPQPTAGVGPGGLTLVAPPSTGGTTGTSKYGLGAWGGQTVNPGDLPILTGIVSTNGQTTGDSIMKAFLAADAGDVATIQHALFMAGYYPKTYTPKWGVISPADRDAFGNLITIAGQSGAPVSSVLESSAAYGAAAGLAAAQQQTRAAAHATITLPNTTDLEALAVKAYENVLGHKASPKAAAKFAAAYRAMSGADQRANALAAYQAQTGITAPSGDPAQLVEQATTNPQANPPWMNRTLAHELGSGENPNSVPPATFDQQIGGLMQLGQQIQTKAAPTSAAQTGLTESVQNTPVSADVAAENYARSTHPHQAAANDVANTFSTFLQLLNGIGG